MEDWYFKVNQAASANEEINQTKLPEYLSIFLIKNL